MKEEIYENCKPNLSMVRSLQEIEEGSEMAVRVKEA